MLLITRPTLHIILTDMMDWSHSHAKFVERRSQKNQIYRRTTELILEKNHSSATSVDRALLSNSLLIDILKQFTWKSKDPNSNVLNVITQQVKKRDTQTISVFTLRSDHLNVNNVTQISLKNALWIDMLSLFIRKSNYSGAINVMPHFQKNMSSSVTIRGFIKVSVQSTNVGCVIMVRTIKLYSQTTIELTLVRNHSNVNNVKKHLERMEIFRLIRKLFTDSISIK
jgi:hypothetical protein